MRDTALVFQPVYPLLDVFLDVSGQVLGDVAVAVAHGGRHASILDEFAALVRGELEKI